MHGHLLRGRYPRRPRSAIRCTARRSHAGLDRDHEADVRRLHARRARGHRCVDADDLAGGVRPAARRVARADRGGSVWTRPVSRPWRGVDRPVERRHDARVTVGPPSSASALPIATTWSPTATSAPGERRPARPRTDRRAGPRRCRGPVATQHRGRALLAVDRDRHLGRPVDDVGVGQDVTRRVDHDAGAGSLALDLERALCWTSAGGDRHVDGSTAATTAATSITPAGRGHPRGHGRRGGRGTGRASSPTGLAMYPRPRRRRRRPRQPGGRHQPVWRRGARCPRGTARGAVRMGTARVGWGSRVGDEGVIGGAGPGAERRAGRPGAATATRTCLTLGAPSDRAANKVRTGQESVALPSLHEPRAARRHQAPVAGRHRRHAEGRGPGDAARRSG